MGGRSKGLPREAETKVRLAVAEALKNGDDIKLKEAMVKLFFYHI